MNIDDDPEYNRPSILRGTASLALIDALSHLGDLYGPKGVADIANELAESSACTICQGTKKCIHPSGVNVGSPCAVCDPEGFNELIERERKGDNVPRCKDHDPCNNMMTGWCKCG